MALTGPSRTIVVEPVRLPETAPAPEKRPAPAPAPVPVPGREKAPA